MKTKIKYHESFFENSLFYEQDTNHFVTTGDIVSFNSTRCIIVIGESGDKIEAVVCGLELVVRAGGLSNYFRIYMQTDLLPTTKINKSFFEKNIEGHKILFRLNETEDLQNNTSNGLIELHSLIAKTTDTFKNGSSLFTFLKERFNDLNASFTQEFVFSSRSISDLLDEHHKKFVHKFDSDVCYEQLIAEHENRIQKENKQENKDKNNMTTAKSQVTVTEKVSDYARGYVEAGVDGAKDGASYAAANYITNAAVNFFAQFVPGIQAFNKTELGHTCLVVVVPFLIGVVSIWAPNTFSMVGLSTEQIQEISRRSCRAAVSHRITPLLDGLGEAMAESLRKAASALAVNEASTEPVDKK